MWFKDWTLCGLTPPPGFHIRNLFVAGFNLFLAGYVEEKMFLADIFTGTSFDNFVFYNVYTYLIDLFLF